MSGSTSGKRISTSRWKKWSSNSNISRNIIQLSWKRAGTAAMIVIDNQRAEALKLRLLLIVPFYVPVTGGDSGGFMSTVAESTATAQWEESVAKSALLEMSGEELLGLLAEGVPDSAAAATALPLKRAEEFSMAAFCAKQSSIDHPHEPGHTDACLG
ncbi:unnamed protein product [Sphagnum jensenii]|uniref:Uncharacterized protein n=1 Tax=Sphagnum jensenii TaxID=128206 RepID=A0ABP1AN30_9BRYO